MSEITIDIQSSPDTEYIEEILKIISGILSHLGKNNNNSIHGDSWIIKGDTIDGFTVIVELKKRGADERRQRQVR